VVVNRIVALISPEEVTEISKKEKVASNSEDDESVRIRLVPSPPSPLSSKSSPPLSSSPPFSPLSARASTTP
jgi:hypothetical protein